jgi:hypothetical protein
MKPRRATGGLVVGVGALLLVLWVMGPGAAQQAVKESGLSAQVPSRASSGPVTAAVALPVPHIGSVVESGNWRYSVRQSDVGKTVTQGTGYFATTKTAKGLWVVVLMQLTNVGNANFSINYFDFELRDDKGIKYTPELTSDLNPPPGYTNLGESFPPGVPLLTRLYFDVAPGTTGMRIHLVQGGSDIALF